LTGKVEAKLNADGDVWVGQRVPLTVKILAPGFSIEGVPAFDLPEVSGLIVLKLSGSPTIGNETIEDVSYVTQLHEFALFPQRAGEFIVPAFSVRFSSSAGYGKPVTPFDVKTELLKFSAQLPPGAEKLQTMISTNQLTFDQSWSPDVTSAKVGEAVTRTITMKADDIPGMEFPPLSFDPIEGVGVYPKSPFVNDISERGSLAGQRVESVTYVFEKPGSYALPGLSLAWWKLDDKDLKQETLAGRTISVAGPPRISETAQKSPPDPRNSRWLWLVGITLALGTIATMTSLLLRRRPDKVHEEAVLFSALETACRTNDRRCILAALTAWLDHRSPSSKPIVVRRWVDQSGDKELIELVDRLETDLYQRPATTADSPFPGQQLLVSLRQLRHQQVHVCQAHANHAALAPLNPL
ncbi:MAG: BatD family protein, partial [Planctomycetaceae bacterium]|nr:BatD family protein [Planctomycetaceae bacterium]